MRESFHHIHHRQHQSHLQLHAGMWDIASAKCASSRAFVMTVVSLTIQFSFYFQTKRNATSQRVCSISIEIQGVFKQLYLKYFNEYV